MTGVIVGIQDPENKIFRVITYTKPDAGSYNKYTMSEGDIVKAIASGNLTLENAKVEGNKLKNKTGDLGRFTAAKNFRPMVLLSEMVAEGKVIGYRLASYDGKVAAIRIKDVLAYCGRVNSVGVPIQNAMYVPESNGQKAHLRAYPGQTFYQEVIERKKPKTAQPATVNKKANEKQVSKLEELFTPAQIEQLKLGKLHGVDIRIFGNNKLSAAQMKELRLGLEDGVNAKAFADPAYSVSTMKALRINAKYGVDIAYFVNPKYNAEQIYELSTGYLSGIDLNAFADPSLSAKDMAKKRVYLESKLWNEVQAD